MTKWIQGLIKKELQPFFDKINADMAAHRKKWHEDDKSWREAFQARQNDSLKTIHDWIKSFNEDASKSQETCLKEIADAIRSIPSSN